MDEVDAVDLLERVDDAGGVRQLPETFRGPSEVVPPRARCQGDDIARRSLSGDERDAVPRLPERVVKQGNHELDPAIPVRWHRVPRGAMSTM